MKHAKFFTAVILSASILTSCSELFENRIPMDNITQMAYLSDLVVPVKEIESLDPPAQIFVSQAEYSNKINITWSPVEGATSYCIERAVVRFEDTTKTNFDKTRLDYEVVPMALHVYLTSFSDVIIQSPTYSSEEYNNAYFYRVSAENSRLKLDTSDYTYSDMAYLLAPPSRVTASLGESLEKIVVKWEKVRGAKYYDVYRSQLPDGSSAVKVAEVPSNQPFYNNLVSKEEQGKEFYYTVQTRTSSNISVTSVIAMGYSLQSGAPGAAQNVVVLDGRGDVTAADGITIKWDTLTATPEDATYSLYIAVYRTSTKDASLTLLKSQAASVYGSGAQQSYKDTKSLKGNDFYYYQVQGFFYKAGEDKIAGPFSDSGMSSQHPAEGYIISPVTNVDVLKNSAGTKCTISFNPAIGSRDCPDNSAFVTDFNNYSYAVYGCTTAADEGTSLISKNDTDLTLEGEKYSIEVDSYPYYKLETILTSDPSVKSAKTSAYAPAPNPARNLQVTRAAYITGVTEDDGEANSLGVHAVKLTWLPPDDGICDGGYYVYRSTDPNEGFKKITSDPVVETEYIDRNETAKIGTYYYYKVLSLNNLKQGVNYSNTYYGYGALTAEYYMREYNKTVKNSQKKLTLMHKPVDTDKLGSETIYGTISGSLSYKAAIAGLGAEITMHYTNYADYYIGRDSSKGVYFLLNGNTDTTSNMSANGNMHESVTCTGMYPGAVRYNNLQIKGGAAGGGTYGITRTGFPGIKEVSWTIGEE